MTLIRANSRAILSRLGLVQRQIFTSVLQLQILILLFHLTRHCKFTPFSQRLWSPKKNYPAHWTTCMFNLLLETSSNADQGLGLHLDAPVHEVAIKWWLGMDTSQGSQCALCPGNALTLWDIMPPLVSVAVMWWYDTTPFVMFWLKHATGPILASKWKLEMTPQPIIATPILLTFC
eukprot:Em0022g146a